MAVDRDDSFVQDLDVELSEQEVAQRAQELARVTREELSAESERKESAGHYRKLLSGIRSRQQELALVVQQRRERRSVDCLRVYDRARAQVAEIRLDTNACIGVRAMTPAEVDLIDSSAAPDEVYELSEGIEAAIEAFRRRQRIESAKAAFSLEKWSEESEVMTLVMAGRLRVAGLTEVDAILAAEPAAIADAADTSLDDAEAILAELRAEFAPGESGLTENQEAEQEAEVEAAVTH